MTFDETLAHDLRDTTTFFQGQFNAESVTVVVCCALALYNAIMLLTLIFITFRKFESLYFWSLVVASSGIIPYTLGFMIEYFQLTSQVAGLVITAFGWPMMVTGQSLVLYSRLGVVLGPQHQNLLKAAKWMIIVDGLVLHVSTTVVVFGAYFDAPHVQFALAYRYIEKIQMTMFTIQEFILSGLYVFRTMAILKTANPHRKRTKRVMWQLFSMNVLIIIFDVALLVVEYQDRHVIEQALKQVIYSVKLKFEFAILSKLAGLTKQGDHVFLGALEDYDDLLNHDRTRSVDSVAATTTPLPRKPKLMEKRLDLDRSSSAVSGLNSVTLEHKEFVEPQATLTADQKRKRRTLEEDMYAGVCRDLAAEDLSPGHEAVMDTVHPRLYIRMPLPP